MSIDLVTGALGAAGCAAAGLLVPALIGRIPEPDPAPAAVAEGGQDVTQNVTQNVAQDGRLDAPARPSYAEVAAAPALTRNAALTCLLAGGLIGAALGPIWPLLYLLPLVPIGVALAVIDLRTRLLPTAVIRPTFAGIVLLAGLSAYLDGDPDALVRAAVAAAVVFGVFFALWWIHPPGMGYGDVRLSAVLGFALGYLGWPEVLIGIYGAFLAFAVPGLLIAAVRRDRGLLAVAYPFGPFLLAGALAGVVLADPVWTHLVGR